MKILVTGAKGQLGTDVVDILKNEDFEVYGFSREELNVTNEGEVQRVISELTPDVIIHTAAFTKVDLAEKEVETAYQVNAVGTRNVVVAAEKIGAKVCYLSTDYVFDGTGTRPYHEYDVPNPLSIYGKSKLAGEVLTQSLCSRYFIVRTSWVYGHHGNNFVKTMLRLANEQKEINVVCDQIGSPTYSEDLAEFLTELVKTERYGIYHASNRGNCSWYEFAKEIFSRSGFKIIVNPISTEEYPSRVRRPAYSVLDDIAIRVNGFSPLPHWKEGLDKFFNKMEKRNDGE